MVRANIATGASILIAFLLTAGLASAGPLGALTGEGGGEVAGEATGGYYVDASGATDAAAENAGDLHERATETWHQSNDAYEEARSQAKQAMDAAEAPAMPQCECERIFDELDQVSSVEAEHTDKVEKAMDVETDYVDAGADLSAAGHVKAFFSDAFNGLRDTFTGIDDLFRVDTSASEDAKSTAKQALHTDDEIRGELTKVVEEERELPELDPRADGSLDAQHASEITSDVLASGNVEIP